MAQISIPLPGGGPSIQIGPQQDNRGYDNRGYDNRGYGGGSSIRLLEATYGRNCRGGTNNAINDIAQACGGRDYCQYYIDVRRLGDPAPGCAKEYQARFICRDGGNEIWATARAEANGQSVTLDCRRR